MEVTVEGYKLRYVFPYDVILPEDYNNKVYVLQALSEKIDKIIRKIEEYWERA